jgi:hypothetical protein
MITISYTEGTPGIIRVWANAKENAIHSGIVASLCLDGTLVVFIVAPHSEHAIIGSGIKLETHGST